MVKFLHNIGNCDFNVQLVQKNLIFEQQGNVGLQKKI